LLVYVEPNAIRARVPPCAELELDSIFIGIRAKRAARRDILFWSYGENPLSHAASKQASTAY